MTDAEREKAMNRLAFLRECLADAYAEEDAAEDDEDMVVALRDISEIRGTIERLLDQFPEVRYERKGTTC